MNVLFSISSAAGVDEDVTIFSAMAAGPTPAASTAASLVAGRAEMVFTPRAKRTRGVVRRQVFMIVLFVFFFFFVWEFDLAGMVRILSVGLFLGKGRNCGTVEIPLKYF